MSSSSSRGGRIPLRWPRRGTSAPPGPQPAPLRAGHACGGGSVPGQAALRGAARYRRTRKTDDENPLRQPHERLERRRGGAHAVVERLRDEHEVSVACPAGGPLADAVDARRRRAPSASRGGLSLRLHPMQTPVGLGQLAAGGLALARAARRFAPDVVHANTLRAGLMAAIAAAARLPPFVVRAHDTAPRLGRACARARAQRGRGRGRLRLHGAPLNEGLARPVAVRVYNSIDHARFDPDAVRAGAVREELGLAPGARLLGQVAQITPWKGQDTSIRTLASCAARHRRPPSPGRARSPSAARACATTTTPSCGARAAGRRARRRRGGALPRPARRRARDHGRARPVPAALMGRAVRARHGREHGDGHTAARELAGAGPELVEDGVTAACSRRAPAAGPRRRASCSRTRRCSRDGRARPGPPPAAFATTCTPARCSPSTRARSGRQAARSPAEAAREQAGGRADLARLDPRPGPAGRSGRRCSGPSAPAWRPRCARVAADDLASRRRPPSCSCCSWSACTSTTAAGGSPRCSPSGSWRPGLRRVLGLITGYVDNDPLSLAPFVATRPSPGSSWCRSVPSQIRRILLGRRPASRSACRRAAARARAAVYAFCAYLAGLSAAVLGFNERRTRGQHAAPVLFWPCRRSPPTRSSSAPSRCRTGIRPGSTPPTSTASAPRATTRCACSPR